MHIPDGFLDTKTITVTASLAAIGVGTAVRQVRRTVPASRVPLIGLSAAFIFSAQMLNFPVAGGTSGHLIGAALAVALLGPGAAVLVMSSVVILQCLMFADGGLTVLGANLLNMAVVAPFTAWLIYRGVIRLLGDSQHSRLTALAFAAWCSTVVASIFCAGELAFSGMASGKVVFTAMAGVHMLIGIGEAVISALVATAVAQLRPELLHNATNTATAVTAKPSYKPVLWYGLVVSLGLVIFVAPFASSWPDGLEKVAEAIGFSSKAVEGILPAPVPDYTFPGLESAFAATVIAGLIGTLVVFGLSYLLARLLTPSKGSHSITTTM